MIRPHTPYARSGDVHIAYQVIGVPRRWSTGLNGDSGRFRTLKTETHTVLRAAAADVAT